MVATAPETAREAVHTRRWYYYRGPVTDSEEWSRRCCLFAGSAHPELAAEVAGYLGVPLSRASVGSFADTEVSIEILDSVRGRDVFLLQPVSRGFTDGRSGSRLADSSVNDALVELLLFVTALRRASALSITVVLPYYGYARQDRRNARVPIGAADVAHMLTIAGITRVVAMDLHTGQTQGFFPPSVPVDNLSAMSVAAGYFAEEGLGQAVVVSPDAGGVSRAKEFQVALENVAKKCIAEATDGAATRRREGSQKLAMLVKQRNGASKIERMDLVGSVVGRDVILVDDILDTAGTLCTAAAECKRRGASRVFAFCTHGLFSGAAARRLAEACIAGDLEYVVVTNTVQQMPFERWSAACGGREPRLKVLTIAAMLAEALKRLSGNESLNLRSIARL